MQVLCSAFRASPLADGRLQLDIEMPATPAPDGALDPNSTRQLYVADLVRVLRKSAKTIYKLSNRRRDPLPMVRGKGRPFAIEASVARWMSGAPERVRSAAL